MSTEAQGSLSYVAIAQETAYDTVPAVAFTALSLSNETLGSSATKIVSSEVRPDRTVPNARKGNNANQGTITSDFYLSRYTPLWNQLLGGTWTNSAAIVPGALADQAYTIGTYVSSNNKFYLVVKGGTVVTVAPALTHTSGIVAIDGVEFLYVGANTISIYHHTLNGAATLPTGGITAEKGILGGTSDFYDVFTGGRVDSGKLTIPKDGIVQVAWDLIFRQLLPPATATASTGAITTPTDESVTSSETVILLSGTENYDAEDGNLTITNNIEKDNYVIGSKDRRGVNPGRRECSGALTLVFVDATEYDLFLNESTFSLAFCFRDLSGNFMKITFNEVKFFGDPLPKISGQGTIKVSYEWQAFKRTAATDVTVELWNQNAAA